MLIKSGVRKQLSGEFDRHNSKNRQNCCLGLFGCINVTFFVMHLIVDIIYTKYYNMITVVARTIICLDFDLRLNVNQYINNSG